MIIVISGTSSSGKSSVCEALFEKLGKNWLYFSTDGYLSMLGPHFLGLHPDNPSVCIPNDVIYARKHDDGTYEIIPGKLCSNLFSTIPEVVSILARQGFNIIIDSFLTSKEDFEKYKNAFFVYGVLFVYLYADEKIINQREESRGDRLKGSAVHWMNVMNHESYCDISLDSGLYTVKEISDKIVNELENH